MAVAAHTSALKDTSTGGFGAIVQAVKTRFVRYRLYRQTVSELSALTNRELADLGLNRSMIRGLAHQAAADFTAQ